MTFEISDGAKYALGKLHSAGYEAYIVGGSIRDMIMGLPVHDYDITTNATPDKTKEVFFGELIIETGIKHGTVTLVYNGENIEITTYRIDGDYKDNRHPDSVKFTSLLAEDLRRRDFTMNAIAYDGKSTLVDPFSGKKDIENKIIRAIGNPAERFGEDALRILRGIRFSSVLGFEIERETRTAMTECLDLLDNIARERIAVEINKFLCGKNVKDAILENYEILGKIIPEVIKMHGFKQNTKYHIYDVLTHTAYVVQGVRPVTYMRLAAFLHDTGKVYSYTEDENGTGHFYGHPKESEKIARDYLNEYRYDNFTKNKVIALVKEHDNQIQEDEVSVKRKLNKFGKEFFTELVELQIADNGAQNPEYLSRKHYEKLLEVSEKIAKESCFTLKSLNVNGSDIIKLGIPAGKEVGIILSRLLSDVIDGKISNEKEELEKRATEIVKEGHYEIRK